MHPRWSVRLALFAVIALLLVVATTYGAVGTLSREEKQHLMLDIRDVPVDVPIHESQSYNGLSEAERQLLLLDIDDVHLGDPLGDDDWAVSDSTAQPQSQSDATISEAGASAAAPTPVPTWSHTPSPIPNTDSEVLPGATDHGPSMRPEKGTLSAAGAGSQLIPVDNTISPVKQLTIATLTMLCGAVVLWGWGLYSEKRRRRIVLRRLHANLADSAALKAIPQAQLVYLTPDAFVLHGQAMLLHAKLESSRKLREHTTAWLGCLDTAIQYPDLMELNSLDSFGDTDVAVDKMISELESIKTHGPACLLQLITTELPLLSGVKKQVHASRMQLCAAVRKAVVHAPLDTAALESMILLVEATSLDDPELKLFVDKQVGDDPQSIHPSKAKLRKILCKAHKGRTKSMSPQQRTSLQIGSGSPRPASTPMALTAAKEIALPEPSGDTDTVLFGGGTQYRRQMIASLEYGLAHFPEEQRPAKKGEFILAVTRDRINAETARRSASVQMQKNHTWQEKHARDRDDATYMSLRAIQSEDREWQQTQKLKQREEEAEATRASHHKVLLQNLASVSMLGVLAGVVARLSSTLFTVQSLLAWFEYSCEEQQTQSSWFPLGVLSGATSTMGCHARGLGMAFLCGLLMLLVLVFCLKFLSVRATSIVVSGVLAWSNIEELRRVWAQLLRTCAPALLVVMLVHVVTYARLREHDITVRDQWMLGSVNVFPGLVYGLWPAVACFICFELGWFTAGNRGDGLAVAHLWAILSPA